MYVYVSGSYGKLVLHDASQVPNFAGMFRGLGLAENHEAHGFNSENDFMTLYKVMAAMSGSIQQHSCFCCASHCE